MFDWLRSRLRLRSRSHDDPHALAQMANIAADRRQVEEGLRLAERALAADSGLAAAHYAMGRLWDQSGRSDRAEASYRRAIELDPRHARAHNNLGCVLSFQERREEALECFRRALELDPQQPEANQNYAAMMGDVTAQEIAIEGYLRQTRENPADARAFNNLANIQAGLGRNKDAMANLERAIALEPDRAEPRSSRALLLLSEGDYAAGWPEYQWRWRLDNPLSAPARRFAQPIWDGSDLGDGALFMHGELALGEPLQFARYASLAAARCGSVILECAPRVKALLERVAGIDRVTTPQEALPRFAAHVPFFALPHIFGTTLENVPWNGPYVHADPERVPAARSLMRAAGPGLKVGLSWSGNPQNPYNRDRSVPPAQLAPLLAVPGVTFYGLQKDAAAGLGGEARLIDLTRHERDLLDTVAFISQLDLVITVDTMISALAGAMGAPVWVLLNLVPDWRHHVGRPDNPWYPSMRLYRQTRAGQWQEVIDRVALDLRAISGR